MRTHNRKCLLFGGGAVGLLFLLVLTQAVRLQAQNDSAGDACIGCHVSEFNQGVSGSVQHPPFWERQCTVCHLQLGSNWPGNSTNEVQTDITGNLVTQDLLWRKQQRYNTPQHTTEHIVSLDNLDSPLGYRFRLVVGEQSTTATAKSLWVGLDSRQLWSTATRQLTTATGLSGEIGNYIEILTLTAISSDQVMVSWTTDQPLYSWLELQDLAGPDPVATAEVSATSGQNQHPPLRRADDLAIDACYRCHPESSLGASHPVRLYGTRDVIIPEELPTVDGMLTCITCHNPHGGNGKNLLRTENKTELCVTCHYKYKNSSPSTMFRD